MCTYTWVSPHSSPVTSIVKRKCKLEKVVICTKSSPGQYVSDLDWKPLWQIPGSLVSFTSSGYQTPLWILGTQTASTKPPPLWCLQSSGEGEQADGGEPNWCINWWDLRVKKIGGWGHQGLAWPDAVASIHRITVFIPCNDAYFPWNKICEVSSTQKQ